MSNLTAYSRVEIIDPRTNFVLPWIEQGQLAKWLVENSCADRVFFCNSGGEANEAAIKVNNSGSGVAAGDSNTRHALISSSSCHVSRASRYVQRQNNEQGLRSAQVPVGVHQRFTNTECK